MFLVLLHLIAFVKHSWKSLQDHPPQDFGFAVEFDQFLNGEAGDTAGSGNGAFGDALSYLSLNTSNVLRMNSLSCATVIPIKGVNGSMVIPLLNGKACGGMLGPIGWNHEPACGGIRSACKGNL